MEEKKVSVIMSTYNTEEEFLRESIESILNQTYKNLELIIVCDGCERDYKIISTYNDSRIKTICHDKNKGLPCSLNEAIDISNGEYIARMDSDDISVKNRIEEQVKFLEENQEIDICGTSAKLFGSRNKKKTIYLNGIEEIEIQLLYKATLIHPTVMIRKKIFEEFKYNEEFRYSQDFELWSRVIQKYKIAFMPFVGLNYRIHDKQASTEKKEEQAVLSMKVIKNNSSRITGKYEDKIYQTLCVLGGRKSLTRDNYKKISNNIDYIIDNNINYNINKLKKVLYNRYFELILKNKILPLQVSSLNKCIKIYNLKELAEVIKNAK